MYVWPKVMIFPLEYYPIDFSIEHDENTSANQLNKNLKRISEQNYKWKMSFNPDLNKEAREITFSRKLTKLFDPKTSLIIHQFLC